MREYRFYAPGSFEEFLKIAGTENNADIRCLAGGTDLVPRISRERNTIPGGKTPAMAIVSLANLGLDKITEKDGLVAIGAMATLTKVAENPLVRAKLPALCEAIGQMAGFSVRNTATLGGNIMNASPAADSLPPLVVLDARFVLRGASGERRIRAGEFFTGPGKTLAERGEILTAIEVRPGPGQASFRKLGRRAAETLSVVNAAAYVEMENGRCKLARVAVGSAAPTVKECREAARALEGQALTEKTVRAAAALVVKELAPITDIRASDWYRKRTAPVMVARAVMASAGLAYEGR